MYQSVIFTVDDDYKPLTELVLFSEDILVHCFNISIIPDEIVEQIETFTLSLEVDTDSVISFNQSTASVVIVDSNKGTYM